MTQWEQRRLALAAVEAILGRTNGGEYLAKSVYSRDGKKRGQVISFKPCNLDGCGGLRLLVVWPDSRRTWPCSEGLRPYRRGFRII
jgi:hypothetical protein